MKRLAPVTLAIITASFFAGCTKNVTLQNNFNEAEASEALKPGNNTVKGSALLRKQNGEVVTCAGSTVDLVPANAYSNERMTHIYGNTARGFATAGLRANILKFTNHDQRYENTGMRKTRCDAQGFFKFDNVKDGSYFVTTVITWKASGNDYFPQGGALMQRVDVRDGVEQEVVLTH